MAERPDWDDVFLSAALEPAQWIGALATMASHTRSTSGQLIGIGEGRDIAFNLVSHFDTAHLREFVAMGGGSRDINFRIAANDDAIAAGCYDRLLHEADYDAVRAGLRSTIYDDWCEAVGIPFGCQTNLVVDRIGLVGLAVLRTRRDGVTTAADRRVFATAARAARRAIRLQERIEGNQAQLLAGAFEAMSATAFIIDAHGRVPAMTERAEQLVAAGIVRLVDRGLHAAASPLSLDQAVAALTTEGGLDHLRLRIDTPSPAAPTFMEGFRLPRGRWSFGALPHAILLCRAPQQDRAGVAELLALIYRLTAAESDIAVRLFDGTPRATIAATRGVTVETLRGQIKTIYAKTGTRTEAALIRLLAALLG